MAQNNGHPWLDPLWRRVVLVATCAVWALVELMTDNMMWFVMVGVITVYGAYAYLYDYTPSDAGKTPES